VFLDLLKDAGKTILVTDYCYTPQKMDDSWFQNQSRGYISFAADHRELNNIPAYPSPLHQENQDSMAALGDVCNFLYLINPESLTRAELVHAIRNSGYDLVIVDLFAGEEQLTAGDVAAMRQKKQGGSRLVICYMSIGEAEDYRYYWQSSWYSGNPAWLGQENPEWPGNYKVKYWDENWQHILFGNDQSYCKKILDAGFDGVYLDMIDAFEYFEK